MASTKNCCGSSSQPELHVCVLVVVGGASIPSRNPLQGFLGPLKFPQALWFCSGFSPWQLMGAWPERPSSSWPWGPSFPHLGTTARLPP